MKNSTDKITYHRKGKKSGKSTQVIQKKAIFRISWARSLGARKGVGPKQGQNDKTMERVIASDWTKNEKKNYFLADIRKSNTNFKLPFTFYFYAFLCSKAGAGRISCCVSVSITFKKSYTQTYRQFFFPFYILFLHVVCRLVQLCLFKTHLIRD